MWPELILKSKYTHQLNYDHQHVETQDCDVMHYGLVVKYLRLSSFNMLNKNQMSKGAITSVTDRVDSRVLPKWAELKSFQRTSYQSLILKLWPQWF